MLMLHGTFIFEIRIFNILPSWRCKWVSEPVRLCVCACMETELIVEYSNRERKFIKLTPGFSWFPSIFFLFLHFHVKMRRSTNCVELFYTFLDFFVCFMLGSLPFSFWFSSYLVFLSFSLDFSSIPAFFRWFCYVHVDLFALAVWYSVISIFHRHFSPSNKFSFYLHAIYLPTFNRLLYVYNVRRYNFYFVEQDGIIQTQFLLLSNLEAVSFKENRSQLKYGEATPMAKFYFNNISILSELMPPTKKYETKRENLRVMFESTWLNWKHRRTKMTPEKINSNGLYYCASTPYCEYFPWTKTKQKQNALIK